MVKADYAREAMEYIAGLKRVESVVFGASSRAHIEETIRLANELLVG